MNDHDESEGTRIHTILPRPWEMEQDFHDVLYEWMQRAPWFALSAAAHLLIFFILMAVPWDSFRSDPEVICHARPPEVLEDLFEEPEEVIEEPLDEPILEEPRLMDSEIIEEISRVEEERDPGPPEELLFPSLDRANLNDVLGVGGGWRGPGGGKYGARGGGKGGRGTEKAVVAGLDWLQAHQSPDGFWDGDRFSDHCGRIGASICDGAGHSTHDIGLTGLALLAFLGNNSTSSSGPYRETVSRGVRWLRAQQDPDTGFIGPLAGRDFLYDHALATLALSEDYNFTRSPLLRSVVQNAVWAIQRARNPYGGWRYDAPPVGDSDTSVTGWMLFALCAAKDAGLEVDEAALEGGLSWIDEMTDPVTGRIGYDTFGSLSSRTPANDHFPREKGEAMTAVGLLCRIFLGQDLESTPVLRRHADLLLQCLPEWDAEGHGCDMYYWYYGTFALFQLGGVHWKRWESAMTDAVVRSQRRDGDERGSWDPVGPWGSVGGRVYSTALMTLCLEVYYRYSRVMGAR
jgi:hypothetical protein